VFIVDHEMKRVLWGKSLEELHAETTHDVQVLPNGHLLYFRNSAPKELGIESWSSLVEYDAASDQIVWSWEGSPPESFFSPVRGGVQALSNGNILFNNVTTGVSSEITRSGQIVWTWAPLQEMGRAAQQIKRNDLSSFLASNHDVAAVPWVGAASTMGTVGPKKLLWGYFQGAGFPFYKEGTLLHGILSDLGRNHPTEIHGVTVRVNGEQARIFMVFDSFFAIEVPDAGKSSDRFADTEVYYKGALLAKMVSPPTEVYPSRYVAEFARIQGKTSAPPM
jgi:hypothetical protein